MTPAASAAAMTARDALGPQLRGRPTRSSPAQAARELGDRSAGLGQAAPSPRAPRRSRAIAAGAVDQPAQALVVRSGRTTRRRPACRRRSAGCTSAFVSATFWWISLLANRVSAASLGRDERLGLGGAGAVRQRERPARRGASAVRGGSLVMRRRSASRAHHLPTPDLDVAEARARARRGRRGRSGRARPCRSSACRASRSSRSSPTASHERQNS